MTIDGITTCCGAEYVGYFRRSVMLWLETLDSLTVATRHVDDFHRYEWPTRLSIVPTVAFGTHFNKGAALNEALAVAAPTDWVLAFDCDIIPPADWRTLAAGKLKNGYLHGAHRWHNARRLDPSPLRPKGYFSLWHVDDPTYRRAPVFDDWHEHAGHYDTHFSEQWSPQRWRDLGIRLEHQGKKTTHWFGSWSPPELMADLKRRGIRKASRESSSPLGN